MANTKQENGQKEQAATDEPKRNGNRDVKLYMRKGVTVDRVAAEAALGPLVGNASTAMDYSTALMGDLVLQDCMEVMEDDIKAVNSGDMSKLEGLLTAQALALDAMFNNYAKRARGAQYLQQVEAFTRLAMKSQSQCRTTIEAIAEIKAPRSATFIKQANIAQQQQVNNGDDPRAREKDITPTNELLTKEPHAALDTGRTSKAIGIDSQREAMGAELRTAH